MVHRIAVLDPYGRENSDMESVVRFAPSSKVRFYLDRSVVPSTLHSSALEDHPYPGLWHRHSIPSAGHVSDLSVRGVGNVHSCEV